MEKKIEEAVREYLCCGCPADCPSSPFGKCYKKADWGVGCENHKSGCAVSGTGPVFLGLPRGFNRLGTDQGIGINLFVDEEQHKEGFEYGVLNVPVWMYLDENLNTIVRGLSPRINSGFIHIFLYDAREYVNACHEITKSDVEEMD